MEQYDRAKLRKIIQNETHTLRIATINVQGLASAAEKLPQLIALLETWNIDICMVQEGHGKADEPDGTACIHVPGLVHQV